MDETWSHVWLYRNISTAAGLVPISPKTTAINIKSIRWVFNIPSHQCATGEVKVNGKVMEEKFIYRLQFFPPLFLSYSLFIIIVLIDVGLNINIVALIYATLVAVLWNYILTRYFTVVVTDKYLKGCYCWGIYHSISWNSISGVKPIWILGLKFLRLESTSSGRTLWIPLFLENISEFKREVLKRVGVDSLLKEYLDEKVAE